MLKRLFIAASLFAASLFTSAVASDMQTVASATFKLYEGHAPADGMCSVTFIGNDERGALFLTAAHCVEGEDLNVRRMKVDEKDLHTPLSAEVYYLKAVKTLKTKDVAVLQVRDKDINFYEETPEFATAEEVATVHIGHPLIAVGYPAAEVLSIIRGEFSGKVPAIEALGLEAPMYQTTVRVAGGNSGGGLYADFNGSWKLIGVTTAKRRDNEVMTYFQTAETIKEALRGFDVAVYGGEAPATVQPAVNKTAIGLDAYKRNGSGRLDEK